MPVDTTNPLFDDRVEEWQICSDSLRGQQAVKEAGTRYLPMPSGFEANPDQTVRDSLYRNYIERAEFPDLYALTLRGMVGLIHKQEAQIKGIEGTELEQLHEHCTRPGAVPALTLVSLHEQVTEQLLHKGRVGLLADAGPRERGGSSLPFMALYPAESIRNWSPDGSMYVLDESGVVRSPSDEFQWVENKKYRVLRVVDDVYVGQVYATYDTTSTTDDRGNEQPTVPAPARLVAQQGSPTATPTHTTPAGASRSAEAQPGATGPTRHANTTDTLASGGDVYEPKARGGKSLTSIPLVIGGPVRLGIDPDTPPLLGVARRALAIYRLYADYRHQLFNSGQETLVLTGLSKTDKLPTVVGAGVIIGIPANCKAEYVGPSCSGIDAHKEAIKGEYDQAIMLGVQLMDQGGTQQSGSALTLRYGAQTASLVTVARQSAAILEGALRNCARFIGMSEEKIQEITVIPNLEFLKALMTSQDATNLVQVWLQGAISYETLYENFVRGGLASGERTAAEEQEVIDEETPDAPLLGGGPTGGGLDPALDDESGPDSITDEELTAQFGSLAADVVGGE